MNKKLFGLALGAALLLSPLAVLAATFSNVEFGNGDVTISGQGGSTVTATFHVIVPSGQVVEFIQTDVIGDGIAPVDTSVGGTLGLQEGTYDIAVPVKLPPNTGTYTLNVQGAGIYGGIRSISGTDGVVGSASFTGALRVVANAADTSTSSTPAWQSAIDALTAKITALVASLGNTDTPAPSTNLKCTALSAKLVGTQDYTYNQANIMLQGYLLSEGASIPALVAGASFGYKGSQTNAALATYKATNHCL